MQVVISLLKSLRVLCCSVVPIAHQSTQCNVMQGSIVLCAVKWSGVEWSGVEWSGVHYSTVQYNALYFGMECSAVYV